MGAGDETASPCTECQQISVKAIMKLVKHRLVIMISDKSAGVGCHFLLQGIFPTQGSNLGLPHCRQTLYRLSHQGLLKNIK